MMDAELAIRLQKIDDQLSRLISDYESEKGLRKERNREIEARLRALEDWRSNQRGKEIVMTALGAALGTVITSLIVYLITK